MKKAVIVLPTYNEADSIEHITQKIFEVTKKIDNWEVHILVVDSSSPDGTGDIVKGLQKKLINLHLLETPKEGLGRAYMRGFAHAADVLKSFVVFEMDADGQHDPKEIPYFLREVEKGADFVIGSRYIKGGSIPSQWGLDRKIQSILGNVVIRLGFMKLAITDWTDGYRCIKTWIVKSAADHIKPYTGYVFQIALLDFAVKNNARIKEIPVNFLERKHGESKIASGRYIFDILQYIFLNSSFVKFVIVGLIGFGIDFVLSYFLIDVIRQAVWLATLISTEAAILSNFLLNNFWSFAHKRLEANKGSFIWNFLKFNFVSSGSVIIQTVGMQLLSNIFGREYWYIYKIAIIFLVIIPYSYILYNKFIWKDRK